MTGRLWPSALLLVAGCQALPMQSIDCVSSGRCTPVSFILGQPDAASNVNLHAGLNGPYDVLLVGTTLLVADCRNNRVLIWKTLPTTNMQQPDYVLGQPDFNTNLTSYGGVSATSLNCPGSLAYGIDKKSGKGHLAVGDRGNGRVLIWNGMPTASYQPADVVVGQTEMNLGGASNRPTQSTLTDPSVTISDDGKLIVSDQLNSRVLIWNNIPQQDNQMANMVLGQPDYTSGSANNLALMPAPNMAAWLDSPQGNPSSDGTSYIYVADNNNDRVLVWSPFPTLPGQSATQVLGQPALDTINKNVAPSAKTLNSPMGVSVKNNQLLVADQLNSRVLGWNLPLAPVMTPPVPADLVLGQPDFVTSTIAVSASSMTRPRSVTADGQHVVVADTDNNRVLFYNLAGLKSAQPASLVLGQPDFISSAQNNVGKLSEKLFDAPFGIVSDGTHIIISDEQNARLLFYSQLPQSASDAPTAVWGQPDFAHNQRNTGNITDTNLCTPGGLSTDGTRLFVADPCNNRVLIWNTIPTAPAQKADVILGQPTVNLGTSNTGGLSAHSLSAPMAVASDGHHLAVTDTGNNRVLLWNTIPTKTGQDADVVLGQSGYSMGNTQPLDSTSLTGPTGVALDGTHLIVADTASDRVLIWNTIPTKFQAPADLVIGQSAFASDQHLTPPDQASLRSPEVVYQSGSRLYVTDRGNHRILYWNTLPTVNGQSADGIIGQPNAAADSPNYSGDIARPRLTAQALFSPAGLFATTDMLFVADQGNNRIVVVPNPALPY